MPKPRRLSPRQQARRARMGIIAAVFILAGALVATELSRRSGNPAVGKSVPAPQKPVSPKPVAVPSATARYDALTSPTELPTRLTNLLRRVASTSSPAASNTKATNAAKAPRVEPTAASRELIRVLSQFPGIDQVLSADQAAAWRQILQQLVLQGPPAVSAILEFLETNADYAFGRANAGNLGYGTVRLALLDALGQIGGSQALEGLLNTMRTTAHPLEVLVATRALEPLDPARRALVLDSARQTLAMAAQGELRAYDVGPLFEIFKSYGDATVVPDLRNAMNDWKYYAAISLAQLPDAQGLPALVEMAQGTDGNRGIALEMLAQLAGSHPDAQAVILNEARAEKIQPQLWPYLGAVFAGGHYQLPDGVREAARRGQRLDRITSGHIARGNQTFYQGPPPGGFTVDQLNQQLGAVEALLSAIALPDARTELERAKETLIDLLSK